MAKRLAQLRFDQGDDAVGSPHQGTLLQLSEVAANAWSRGADLRDQCLDGDVARRSNTLFFLREVGLGHTGWTSLFQISRSGHSPSA